MINIFKKTLIIQYKFILYFDNIYFILSTSLYNSYMTSDIICIYTLIVNILIMNKLIKCIHKSCNVINKNM